MSSRVEDLLGQVVTVLEGAGIGDIGTALADLVQLYEQRPKEQQAVNVSFPENAVQVHVNVPEQKAPVVNVEARPLAREWQIRFQFDGTGNVPTGCTMKRIE